MKQLKKDEGKGEMPKVRGGGMSVSKNMSVQCAYKKNEAIEIQKIGRRERGGGI